MSTMPTDQLSTLQEIENDLLARILTSYFEIDTFKKHLTCLDSKLNALDITLFKLKIEEMQFTLAELIESFTLEELQFNLIALNTTLFKLQIEGIQIRLGELIEIFTLEELQFNLIVHIKSFKNEDLQLRLDELIKSFKNDAYETETLQI